MNKIEAQTSNEENISNENNIESLYFNEEKLETVENIQLKVDISHRELSNAYETLNRTDGQKSSLAGVRKKLGLTNQSDENINRDYKVAQQQVELAKQNFRNTFAGFGKHLAQEKFGGENKSNLTNEQVLETLFTEKIIETDQLDEKGGKVFRTLSQEYESRLNSAQEKTPTQRGIVSKMFKKYSKIPRHKKLIAGTMLASGMGAITGGVSVAMVAGANKLTKMMMSGATSAAADVLLRKHMNRRDKKNQTTNADFMQRAENVTQESFETAKKGDANIEQGLLEGIEKKMKVFEEMFNHQKAKNKVRIAVAVLSGVAVGGGMFDAADAHATSFIQSGSFDFGGGNAVDTTIHTDTHIDNNISAENISIDNELVMESDTWDIPNSKTMAEGLERHNGIISGEDGRRFEEVTGKWASEKSANIGNNIKDTQPNVDDSKIVSTNNSSKEFFTTDNQSHETISNIKATHESSDWQDIKRNGNERESQLNNPLNKIDSTQKVDNNSGFTDRFLPSEIRNLENVNARSVIMQNSNDSVLNNIKVQIGLPKNESMLEYLDRFMENKNYELTFEQKKHIVELI